MKTHCLPCLSGVSEGFAFSWNFWCSSDIEWLSLYSLGSREVVLGVSGPDTFFSLFLRAFICDWSTRKPPAGMFGTLGGSFTGFTSAFGGSGGVAKSKTEKDRKFHFQSSNILSVESKIKWHIVTLKSKLLKVKDHTVSSYSAFFQSSCSHKKSTKV